MNFVYAVRDEEIVVMGFFFFCKLKQRVLGGIPSKNHACARALHMKKPGRIRAFCISVEE
jgi:hypothetical protein